MTILPECDIFATLHLSFSTAVEIIKIEHRGTNQLAPPVVASEALPARCAHSRKIFAAEQPASVEKAHSSAAVIKNWDLTSWGDPIC